MLIYKHNLIMLKYWHNYAFTPYYVHIWTQFYYVYYFISQLWLIAAKPSLQITMSVMSENGLLCSYMNKTLLCSYVDKIFIMFIYRQEPYYVHIGTYYDANTLCSYMHIISLRMGWIKYCSTIEFTNEFNNLNLMGIFIFEMVCWMTEWSKYFMS